MIAETVNDVMKHDPHAHALFDSVPTRQVEHSPFANDADFDATRLRQPWLGWPRGLESTILKLTATANDISAGLMARSVLPSRLRHSRNALAIAIL